MLDIDIQRKSYIQHNPERELLVLDNIRIKVKEGEFLALVGPSGCGKSTLLQILSGLDKTFEGNITWLDKHSNSSANLGYVFQNPRLLPWLNLRDNITLVLDNPAEKKQQVDELLEATGLSAFSDYHPGQLSIGMQRRAALARAFVVEPSLLIMDEPFVSLDGPTAFQLRQLLLDILAIRCTTVVFVTHDLHEATMLADRILYLSSSPAKVIGESLVDLARDKRTNEEEIGKRYLEIKTLFKSFYQSDRLPTES
ncbi:MAG: ABC transporter ATP-binding protein [Candidatus Thiodiazotropha sp. 6PLUC2]